MNPNPITQGRFRYFPFLYMKKSSSDWLKINLSPNRRTITWWGWKLRQVRLIPKPVLSSESLSGFLLYASHIFFTLFPYLKPSVILSTPLFGFNHLSDLIPVLSSPSNLGFQEDLTVCLSFLSKLDFLTFPSSGKTSMGSWHRTLFRMTAFLGHLGGSDG